MRRPKLLPEFITVATTVAAIVIATVSWVSKQIQAAALSSAGGWMILLLTATGTYFLLIKMALWGYYKWLWAVVHRKTFISGNWRYFYSDNFDPSTKSFVGPEEQGEARIEHTPEGVSIFGETKGESGELVSTWESDCAMSEGQRLDFALRITSSPLGPGQGFALLHVITLPKRWGLLPRLPRQITGHYYIVSSETRSVRWGRTRYERVD